MQQTWSCENSEKSLEVICNRVTRYFVAWKNIDPSWYLSSHMHSPEELPRWSRIPRNVVSRIFGFLSCCAIGKVACVIAILVAGGSVADHVGSWENLNTTNFAKSSGHIRFCSCDVDTDPLGRRGRKGVLTSDTECNACHESVEITKFRTTLISALVRNSFDSFAFVLKSFRSKSALIFVYRI